MVELANFMSGPFATLMLADLGAEVIKVEQPRGDPFRRWGRPDTYVSAVFANCNHGKRSVVLDLKDPDGVDALLRLLEHADVLVCNWRPDVAARLGIGDEVLAGRNRRLIRLYVSGFGPTGPLADEPAFDTVVQARTAMTEALSTTGEPTLGAGYPVDKLTAIMAVQAVLAALLTRTTSGRGERIDLAMLDAASYLSFVDLYTGRTFVDHEPAEAVNRHSSAVRPVRTSDGWLLVAPVTGADIRRACEAVGRPEWGEDILSAPDQVNLVHALFDRIETVTVAASTEVWLGRFRAHDVPVAPCLSVDEHLADPQVDHNGVYRVVEWPDAGAVRVARYPARFSSFGPLVADAPAPPLGADTEAVLRRLGIEPAAG